MLSDRPTSVHFDVPHEESDVAFGCKVAFSDIFTNRANFKAALDLFDYCSTNQFRKWSFIAARDGAMSIYHFARSYEALNAWAKRSDFIFSRVDRSALKRANKLFQCSFPNFERVRNAVAHSAELLNTPEKMKSGTFSAESELVNIKNLISIDNSSSIIVGENINDRTYFTSHNGEIVEYEMSQKTFDILGDVESLLISAYSSVSSAS